MSDMRDLITIASRSTASIDDFEFEHPELYEHTIGDTRIDGSRKPLPYRARWSQRSRTDRLVKQHQFYFTLNDFGGTEGLTRWLTTAQQYRTELGRAMATLYSDTMFLEDRIGNLCGHIKAWVASPTGLRLAARWTIREQLGRSSASVLRVAWCRECGHVSIRVELLKQPQHDGVELAQLRGF